MVAPARLAAGLSGLRNRNTRVTNKTQLRVIKGNIDADPIILDDDDDEKNRVLASQGVDEEDANEHHLQAALLASAQRTLSFAQTKHENAFIPTPDAAGLVSEYSNLYPSNCYSDPVTHLRFSNSIDESCVGGLAGSFTYFLDERDAEWLTKNNGAAKGEGTSTGACGININGSQNATGGVRGIPRTPHSRSAKTKGKEPENLTTNGTHPNVVITEDCFELIMGLFEKWTDEIVSPYLHLAADPEHFPDFDDYYQLFAEPIPSSTFASFKILPNIPTSEQLVQLAKAIYPWWKTRRLERNGQRIVPQVHVLILEAQEKEDKTAGSPYTCFRKRDVKPMRKTRTNNVIHTEKLARLRGELQKSLELAQMVLEREKLKRESVNAAVEVWRTRESLAEYMKQLASTAPGSVPPADELLLFDKERKPRKPKTEVTGTGRIILSTNRRLSHIRGALPESMDPHSPLTLNADTSHAFEECQKWPSARMAGIQREVERELLKTRKDDAYWEDIVDIPYQPMLPSSTTEKLFKSFQPSTMRSSPSSSSAMSIVDADPVSRNARFGRSLRVRSGRGGRLHLDRLLHVPKPHRLLQREWAGYPPRARDLNASQSEIERWSTRSWRPRDTQFLLGRRERELGEQYWSHHSISEDEGVNSSQKQAAGGIRSVRENQDSTFGFEQSVPGWDAREMWARSRGILEEEGWKPNLVVDPENLDVEMAARNRAEREQMVDPWRRKVNEIASGGGALALFTDGGDMVEPNESATQEQDEDQMMVDSWDRNDRTADMIERAWRIDERWRYDHEDHEADDRFLLDDYQSKFLRTTITLLDAKDHDLIQTDPKLLAVPPLKQNRYLDLDSKLRLQHPGLGPLASSMTPTSGTPNPIPLRQIPPQSSAVSTAATVPNGTGVHPQTTSVESATLQNVPSNPTLKGSVPASAISNGTSLYPLPTASPKPNVATIPTVPGGARLPPHSASALRMNASARIKQNGVSSSHPGLTTALVSSGLANTRGDLNGTLPTPLTKGYTSLKTPFDRVIAAQQDPQSLQSARSYQLSATPMNGVVNVSDHAAMSVSLGVGNLQLKLPAQRAMSIKTNGAGENHADGAPGNSPAKQDPYVLAHTQHLSVPRLSSTGTRAV